jgi:hypothetical protein
MVRFGPENHLKNPVFYLKKPSFFAGSAWFENSKLGDQNFPFREATESPFGGLNRETTMGEERFQTGSGVWQAKEN